MSQVTLSGRQKDYYWSKHASLDTVAPQHRSWGIVYLLGNSKQKTAKKMLRAIDLEGKLKLFWQGF